MKAFEPSLFSLLATIPIATPELVASRELHRRVDTKLMLSVHQLERVLGALRDDYAVVLAADRPIAHYRTLYFDTPAMHCFHEHRRGRLPRYKIRIRHYAERSLSYLEIKKKTNAGDTIKQRRALDYQATSLSTDDCRFIEENSPYVGSDLVPALWTDFRRITLIGLRTAERATLDLDLRFESATGEGSEAAPRIDSTGIVIAEIKQAHFQPRSPIFLLLRDQRALQVPVSKYCTAAGLLFAPTRSRLHFPVLRAMKRLEHG